MKDEEILIRRGALPTAVSAIQDDYPITRCGSVTAPGCPNRDEDWVSMNLMFHRGCWCRSDDGVTARVLKRKRDHHDQLYRAQQRLSQLYEPASAADATRSSSPMTDCITSYASRWIISRAS
jgi:hypothetical protein